MSRLARIRIGACLGALGMVAVCATVPHSGTLNGAPWWDYVAFAASAIVFVLCMLVLAVVELDRIL